MLKADPVSITAQEYSQLPEGPPRYQLIDGGLEMSPAPTPYHQQILLNLAHLIQGYLDRHPVGVIFIAPFDVYLSEINVYQPDLVFISKTNAAILTEKGAEGAPDLVVEVLSPKSAQLDKGPKRKIYARTGVKELWIVDPERKQVQVYRLRKDPETPVATHGAEDTFRTALLPGLRILCAKVFVRPKI